MTCPPTRACQRSTWAGALTAPSGVPSARAWPACRRANRRTCRGWAAGPGRRAGARVGRRSRSTDRASGAGRGRRRARRRGSRKAGWRWRGAMEHHAGGPGSFDGGRRRYAADRRPQRVDDDDREHRRGAVAERIGAKARVIAERIGGDAGDLRGAEREDGARCWSARHGRTGVALNLDQPGPGNNGPTRPASGGSRGRQRAELGALPVRWPEHARVANQMPASSGRRA
jgi:hypothetical protein